MGAGFSKNSVYRTKVEQYTVALAAADAQMRAVSNGHDDEFLMANPDALATYTQLFEGLYSNIFMNLKEDTTTQGTVNSVIKDALVLSKLMVL